MQSGSPRGLRPTHVLLGFAALFLVTAPPSAEAASVIQVFGDKCLDIGSGRGAPAANDSNVAIYTCNANAHQQWTVEGNRIRNTFTDRCLTAERAQGSSVDIGECRLDDTTFPGFRWVVQGQQIRNLDSNLCLDVSGGRDADGANVIVWGCHDGPNQKWRSHALDQLLVVTCSKLPDFPDYRGLYVRSGTFMDCPCWNRTDGMRSLGADGAPGGHWYAFQQGNCPGEDQSLSFPIRQDPKSGCDPAPDLSCVSRPCAF